MDTQEQRIWVPYPPEEEAWAAFVRSALRQTSIAWCGWPDRITSGVLDFEGAWEGCPLHQGEGEGGRTAGWADPSSEIIGSCSREWAESVVLQDEPWHVTYRRRDLSLVSLDRPNYVPPDDQGSYYQEVIAPLLELPKEEDDLYGWLDVLFEFCEGKPVGYYSRYVPGPRIRELAEEYGVILVHLPLDRLPEEERERHRWWHFLNIPEGQWEELRRVAAIGERPPW